MKTNRIAESINQATGCGFLTNRIRPQRPELAVFGLSYLSRSTVPLFGGWRWRNVSIGGAFQPN
jgi:hypothetical protein